MAGCTGNGDARTAAAYQNAAAFAAGVPTFAAATASYSPGGTAIFPPGKNLFHQVRICPIILSSAYVTGS